MKKYRISFPDITRNVIYEYKGYTFTKIDGYYTVFVVNTKPLAYFWNLFDFQEWSKSRTIKEIIRRIDNIIKNSYWGDVEEIIQGSIYYSPEKIRRLSTAAKERGDYDKLLTAFEDRISELVADELMGDFVNPVIEKRLCDAYEIVLGHSL